MIGGRVETIRHPLPFVCVPGGGLTLRKVSSIRLAGHCPWDGLAEPSHLHTGSKATNREIAPNARGGARPRSQGVETRPDRDMQMSSIGNRQMRRFFRSTPVAGCGRVRTAVSAPLSFRLHYTAHLHTLGRAFFFFLLPVLICIPMFFFSYNANVSEHGCHRSSCNNLCRSLTSPRASKTQ